MASWAGAGTVVGGSSRAPGRNGRRLNVPPADMRMTIEEVAKKLSLWHNDTLRPIPTHDELEPILVAAGFVPLPVTGEQERPLAVPWREYVFFGRNAASASEEYLDPRPRLPYPRIDGLHIKTYEAFLGALESCLGAQRVANLFHVRLVPVTTPDRVFGKLLRPMRNFTPPEAGMILYRENTLDERTMEACSRHVPMTVDADYHVFPGMSCRGLRHLRKLQGNCCHDEGCCADGSGEAPIVVVPLKDLCPDYYG